MRLNLTTVATLMLAATLTACAQPTEPPPAAEPEITMEAAPEMPTEAPTEAPTAEMAPNAKPAVQLVPLQSPSDVIVGQPAGIAVIAADSDGLSKAELIVDGQVVSTVEIASDTLFQGTLTWTPAAAGSYNAGVVVYDINNQVSDAVAARVTVYEAGATIPTAAPTETGHTAPPAVSITPSPMELAPGERSERARQRGGRHRRGQDGLVHRRPGRGQLGSTRARPAKSPRAPSRPSPGTPARPASTTST